jgi:HEAT repeat protein
VAAAAPNAAPTTAVPRPAKPAQSEVTPRAALESLLRKSGAPPSDAELRGVARNADQLLVAIARDASLELSLRGRAVGALAHVPTAAARGFLVTLIEDPGEALAPEAARRPPGKAGKSKTVKPAPRDAGATPGNAEESRTLVRRAAVSLGWIGGSQAPAIIGPLLAHDDPDVRGDAAVALALTRLPEGARLLRARLPLEKDPRVRSHIARQLNVIEAALGAAAASPPPATPRTQPVRGDGF